MSAHHTPAPWQAKGDYIYARNGMTPIADCDVGLRSRKEREVDARLMAAAPDLLAICQEFIASLGPDGYFPNPGYTKTQKMRAAIAKATGA